MKFDEEKYKIRARELFQTKLAIPISRSEAMYLAIDLAKELFEELNKEKVNEDGTATN